MSFIRSADAALYYEEYGTGETLILLPGLFGTIELDWRRFIPDLSRHFHTIAVDLRGHGKTDDPSGDLSPGRLVADLGVLFDTLEIDRAFLSTYGAMSFLPLAFGEASPERVSGVILHAPVWTWPTEDASRKTPTDPTATRLTGLPVETLQQAHTPDGWSALPLLGEGLLPAAVHETNRLLGITRLRVLMTMNDGAVPGPATATCSVAVLPRCGPYLTTVPKAPFVSAVLHFASRKTESFSSPDRTPE